MANLKERFEEMRLNSKRNLMEAALKLFSIRGYHATPITAIAKEAGVANGLLYNYFSGKEELLVSIIDAFFQELILSVPKESKWDPETPDIRKVIDAIITAVNERKDSWKLLVSVMFQPDVSKMCIHQIDKFVLHQQDLFDQYFQRKGVTNPQETARVLSAILHGAFLRFASSGDLDEMLLLRRTVIENLIENGLS